jgi:hypothetical protein
MAPRSCRQRRVVSPTVEGLFDVSCPVRNPPPSKSPHILPVSPSNRCLLALHGGDDLVPDERDRAAPSQGAGGVDVDSSGPLGGDRGLRQTPIGGLSGKSPPTPRLHAQRIGPSRRLCRDMRCARRRREQGSSQLTNEEVPAPLGARRDAGEAGPDRPPRMRMRRPVEMARAGTDRIACVSDATERIDLEPTTSPLDSPGHSRVRFAITGWRSIECSVERSRERSPRRSSSRELSPRKAPGERP